MNIKLLLPCMYLVLANFFDSDIWSLFLGDLNIRAFFNSSFH